MGLFANLVWSGGWTELPLEFEGEPGAAEPWLTVSVHDSDLAVVGYAPAGPGTGVAYMGFTPRTYFEMDEASPPTDTALEAAGLAAWWAQQQGGDAGAKAAEIRPLLAQDLDPADESWQSGPIDPDDVFVETKLTLLLRLLDLELPPDLG